MKRLILLFLLIPGFAIAQQPPGFDPSKMQEMMKRFQNPEAMQKMAAEAEAAQKCMEGIDRSQLEKLRAEGEKISREIETLCAAGKSDEALARGLSMSRKLNADPTVRKLRECSKKITTMMSEMPWAQMPRGFEDDAPPTKDDICS